MLYANGVPLSFIGVTQNEKGVYYFDKATYFAAPIQNFDSLTAQQREGFRKYSNGSHSSTNYNGVDITKQKALDLRISAGTKITCDREVVVTKVAKDYIVFKEGDWTVTLVHTWKFAKVGTVKPHTTLCEIAPASHSGVAPHLHIFATNSKSLKTIRDYLGSQPRWRLQYGSHVKLREDEAGCVKGAIGKILPKQDFNANHHVVCEFLDGKRIISLKNMSITTEKVTRTNGKPPAPKPTPKPEPKPAPPSDPCKELEKKLEDEQKAHDKTQQELVAREEEISNIKGQLAEISYLHDKAQESYDFMVDFVSEYEYLTTDFAKFRVGKKEEMQYTNLLKSYRELQEKLSDYDDADREAEGLLKRLKDFLRLLISSSE